MTPDQLLQRMFDSRPAVTAVLLLLVVGCNRANLETDYGRRDSTRSVNGTSLLASLFEEAGNSVSSWRRLSPKLDSCSTIVWAPDDFDVPSLESREYLEGWLEDDSGRTLIFVGRDFDPVPDYWHKMIPAAAASERTVLQRKYADALLAMQESRAAAPTHGYARWFIQQTASRQSQVAEISGPWAEDLDKDALMLSIASSYSIPTILDIPPATNNPSILAGPTPAQIRRMPRFLQRLIVEPRSELRDLPDTYQVLLTANQTPFVTRITDDDWDGGKIIVVTNGSFLLNMPLVNHEHRKLAQKLVDECQQPGKVIFLESNSDGLRSYQQDTESGSTTKMEIFRIWPLNLLLIHLLALGCIYCAVVFPIFGAPRNAPQRSPSDFGDHITAIGELLEKTNDEEFARHRLKYYQEHIRR